MPLDAAALRLLGEQLRDPSTSDRQIDVDGHTWFVRKAPRPGVDMTIAVDEPSSAPIVTMYQSAPSPPHGYPTDVPFVADRPAAVTVDPASSRTQMVMWAQVPDAGGLARELEAASLADGWTMADRFDAFGVDQMSVGKSENRAVSEHLVKIGVGKAVR